MKRRNKRLKMPLDPVKHRKLIRRTLRLFQIKAHELDVSIALYRIEHGARPTLYRACSAAVDRCHPERARDIFKSVHNRLLGLHLKGRGKKK